ncbi:MAG: RloB domain-containing protein [Caldisericia bacterium]|nr:RloB domain-containing protein [Caldisericia bacterium]
MAKPRKKTGSLKLQPKLYIICEGKKRKSEYAYFSSFIKSLCFNEYRIKLVYTDKNTGKELVQVAKQSKEFKNDLAWIVYDKDGYTLHPQTFNDARQCNVEIAFSSISFEYWILLHFKYTSRAFSNSEELIKYLLEDFNFNYDKGDEDVYDKIKLDTNRAKTHAKRIQKYQEKAHTIGTPIYNFNPYTNINDLIEQIENICLKEKE